MYLNYHPKLVLDRVIVPTLDALNPEVPYSVQAVELLLGTAATESHMGRWVKQMNGGPAKGIFQMEAATEKDIWENFLRYQPALAQKVRGWRRGTMTDLEWNHSYATAMARVHYWRVREALPPAGDIEGHARYWKTYYNTLLGKGTVDKYLKDWKEIVEGKL